MCASAAWVCEFLISLYVQRAKYNIPMNNLRADIFHTAVEDKGGKLDIEAMHCVSREHYFEPLIARMDDIVNHLRQSKSADSFLDDVYYDFVFNPLPNAFCRKRGGKYFIGINSGLVQIIHDVYFQLFSHPLFLPEIGNAAGEDPQRAGSFAHGFGARQSLAYSNSSFMTFREPPIPKCENRFLMARILSFLTVEFTFCHELGHILTGSLDYLSSLQDDATICELNSEKDNLPRDQKIQRHMEYSADSFAIFHALAEETMFQYFREEESISAFRFDLKELSYYGWFFCICILFRIFSQHGLPARHYRQESHPHPQMRIYGNWMNLRFSKVVNEDPDTERILDLCAKAVIDVGKYWTLFQIPGFQYDANSDSALTYDLAVEIQESKLGIYETLAKSREQTAGKVLSDIINGGPLQPFGLVDNTDEILRVELANFQQVPYRQSPPPRGV